KRSSSTKRTLGPFSNTNNKIVKTFGRIDQWQRRPASTVGARPRTIVRRARHKESAKASVWLAVEPGKWRTLMILKLGPIAAELHATIAEAAVLWAWARRCARYAREKDSFPA